MDTTDTVSREAKAFSEGEGGQGRAARRRYQDGEMIDSCDFFKGMHAAYEDIGGAGRYGNA